MKLYLGVTDTQWFRFLWAEQLEEVNFWQPEEKRMLVMEPGEPEYREVLSRVRVGQGTFRTLITDAYQRPLCHQRGKDAADFGDRPHQTLRRIRPPCHFQRLAAALRPAQAVRQWLLNSTLLL